MANKKYRLRYLPLFEQDLVQTVSYITNVLKNPEAAEKLVNDVEGAILERLNNPLAFEAYPSAKNRKYPYYRIYIRNYVVYYLLYDRIDRFIAVRTVSVIHQRVCFVDKQYTAFCFFEFLLDALFSKLHPYLLEHIKNESEFILGDQDSFDEPVDHKFYWSVTKFIQIQGEMYELYRVFLTLSGDIIGVEGYPFHFDKCARRFPESIECFSDEQKFILSYARQISSPLNVILPYQPGDILYVDANPFGKPFYAVYCAETMADRDHFEWTKKEYGFYKREHPCLYISEDHAGPAITKLTEGFTDYIWFPYSPLDRIQVVETCDDTRLLNASGMLKDNPDIFRKWCDRY